MMQKLPLVYFSITKLTNLKKCGINDTQVKDRIFTPECELVTD
jgi:hypothetical protein